MLGKPVIPTKKVLKLNCFSEDPVVKVDKTTHELQFAVDQVIEQISSHSVQNPSRRTGEGGTARSRLGLRPPVEQKGPFCLGAGNVSGGSRSLAGKR